MNTKSAPTHLGHLDGLRAYAALFVVLHHAMLQVQFPAEMRFGAARPLLVLLRYGHYAVDIFIVLSGFCLMLPVVRAGGTLRGGAFRFFKRRAVRIVPPYYAAMGLSLLLIRLLVHRKTGTHWDISLPVGWHSIVTHLLLIQDLTRDEYTINHAFWSISVEWRIYFLFPLLVWCWRKVGPLWTTLLTITASVLLSRGFELLTTSTYSSNFIGLFAMGMLAAGISCPGGPALERLRRWPWTGLMWSLAAAATVLTFARIHRGDVTPLWLRDYVVGAWSAALLIVATRDERTFAFKVLSWKPAAVTGAFAYSIYLIHAPLLQVLWQYPFAGLQTKPVPMFLALTLAGVPLIIGVSYLFFLLFERPFMQMGRARSLDRIIAKSALEPAP